MAQVTKETLIAAMHIEPQNEREIGFNSALIFILKRLSGVEDEQVDYPTSDSHILKSIFKQHGVSGFDKLTKSDISSIKSNLIAGSKLQAVKDLKSITDLGLKESKDIVDAWSSIIS